MQETQDLEQVLSFLVFGDGCAAASSPPNPPASPSTASAPSSSPTPRDLITWRIRGVGFDMLLSGKVPAEIGKALGASAAEVLGNRAKDDITLWGVHPGGKSVLDAVERGLALPPEALNASRTVLDSYGNMSSATVMFVLAELMRSAKPGQQGCAMSFGPGLTAETMLFHAA